MKPIQQKKNQRLILLLFSMTFLPFLVAVYLHQHPALLGSTTNHGELIIPPIPTNLAEFSGVDDFSSNNMQELRGHWVLMNVIPTSNCASTCLEALHKTKQLLLMMNKDLTRMRRVVILLQAVDPQKSAAWWVDDNRLLRAHAQDSLLQKIMTIKTNNVADGSLLLMDPLGNLMMQYAPGFDPYQVKEDLRKLLAVSQIG